MHVVTIDDFLNYFPEFSAITDKTPIALFLEESRVVTNVNRCPSLGKLMQLFYTAHALTKSSFNPEGLDDSVGVPISQNVNGVSETRDIGTKANRSYADNWFSSTMYGNRYLQLRASCFGGGLVVP